MVFPLKLPFSDGFPMLNYPTATSSTPWLRSSAVVAHVSPPFVDLSTAAAPGRRRRRRLRWHRWKWLLAGKSRGKS